MADPASAVVALSLPGGALGSGLLVGLATALVLVTILLALEWRARNRRERELGELVGSLEAVIEGTLRAPPAMDDGTLAVVSSAVGRLAHDLHASRRDAERAHDQVEAVSTATRDVAVIVTDPDGDVLEINEQTTEMLGWPEGELRGRSVAVLFDAEAYRELLPKLARRELRDNGLCERSEMVRRDGSTLPVELSVHETRPVGSSSSGLLIVARDISRTIAREREIAASEERYRELVDGLAEPVAIVRDGRIVFVNPAFRRRFNLRGDEALGTSFRERVATRDVLRFDELLDEAETREGPPTRVEVELIDAEPGRFQATVRKIAFDREPAVLVVLAEQPRRRATPDADQVAAQLDAILEASADGLLVISERNGRSFVRMSNQAFAELSGLPLSAVLGSAPADLAERLLEIDGPGTPIARALLTEQRRMTEEVTVGEDEQARDLSIQLAPLTAPDGTSIGRILVCRDQTEQRRSERELQRFTEQLQLSKERLAVAYANLETAHGDLRERNQQLDRLNSELRRLDAMKSDLLGNVTHELQTPLVSIRGYTEMIAKARLGPVTEEQKKGLTLSLRNIDRLIGMIDNLVAFSSREKEYGRLTLSSFPLAEVVAEARATVASQLTDNGLCWESAIPPGLAVEADRDRIVQVFLNLSANAIKFTGRGGTLRVEARVGEQGRAQVVFSDTGAGIPSGELDRIFERNYQAGGNDERSARPGGAGGSGIGLSIVRDILRMHGCRIHVTSELGKGTKFHFDLPLAEGQELDADAEIEAAVEAAVERRPRFRVINKRDEEAGD